MNNERVQKILETLESAIQIAGAPPLPLEDRRAAEKALFLFLPLWDELMPLLVGDIVKTVKKELQNG